jgi:hypothetical protein
MAMECTNGQMVAFIKVIGFKTKSLVMVNILGTIKELTKDTGLIIICMVKEYINGRTVENMKEII